MGSKHKNITEFEWHVTRLSWLDELYICSLLFILYSVNALLQPLPAQATHLSPEVNERLKHRISIMYIEHGARSYLVNVWCKSNNVILCHFID